MLKVNKKFAKKYDEYRRKEELQKMKDRYGDAKLSEVKRQAAAGDSASSSSSSSSESEDSDAEAWTPGMEAGFLRVYAALQTGDSRLYDPAVSWFQDAAAGRGENGGDGENGSEGEGEKDEKHKPMYYNEYHRKFLLEGAYENDDQEGGAAATTEATQRDLQEAERIRKSLAEAHAKDSDSEDEANDQADGGGGGGAAFLTKRRRKSPLDVGEGGGSNCRPAGSGGGGDEGDDPVQRLHKFVSDRADDGKGLEAEYKEDLAKLKRHWTSEAKLTPAERYLRDYITKEYWRPRQPSEDDDDSEDEEEEEEEQDAGDGKGEGDEKKKRGTARDSDEDVSADEAFLARQSEFEAKWNCRTEERDPGFESVYKRTFASGDANGEGEEDDDDDELFVVAAKKSAEAEAAAETVDSVEAAEAELELRRLERRRSSQWKAADSGSCEKDEAAADEAGDLLGTTAAAAGGGGIRTYPRRIADSLRQSSTATAAADCARSKRRSERRERRREEKLAKRRELGQLAMMKEAELERRLDRLRRNAGLGGGGGGGEGGREEAAGDKISATLGGDFLEADFDPAEHDKRMANLFGDDFYGEGEAGGKRQAEQQIRRPEFSDDEELRPEADAEAEAEELRRRLQAEVDRLHAEDFIRAGPGQEELRCRFNYRQVEPNDFGLSAVEVLLADDRELNAWCSVRKASQYRGRDADWRDRRRYRSAHAQARKAQLMPGMLRRLEAAAAYADADAWTAAASSAKLPATSTASAASDDDDDVVAGAGATTGEDGEKKKRRRQKKKKKLQQQQQKKQLATQDEAPARDEAAPRSRKRPKPSLDQSGEPSPVELEQQQQAKKPKLQKQKKQKQKKAAAGRLQISEQRLLELGIDPRKFHRMRRSQQQLTPSTAEVVQQEAQQQQPQQQKKKKKRKQKMKMEPSVASAAAAADY